MKYNKINDYPRIQKNYLFGKVAGIGNLKRLSKRSFTFAVA